MGTGHSMIHATPPHKKSPATDGSLAAKALAHLKKLEDKAKHTGDLEKRAVLLMVAASVAHYYETMGYNLHGAGRAIAKMAISSHLAEYGEHPDINKIRDLEQLFKLSSQDMHEAFSDAGHALLRERRHTKATTVNRIRASWESIPLLKD